MRTLSQKLLTTMKAHNVTTCRATARLTNLSHSTIHKILQKNATGLRTPVKEKLMLFSKEITEADFTEPNKRGAKSKVNLPKEKDLTALLEQYKTKTPTYADILRSIYL